jgi:hypothetical protein
MYTLIGLIVAFFVLAAAIAAPSNSRFCNERPRGRRVPGDANAPKSIVAEETALAPYRS